MLGRQRVQVQQCLIGTPVVDEHYLHIHIVQSHDDLTKGVMKLGGHLSLIEKWCDNAHKWHWKGCPAEGVSDHER